MYQNCTKNNFRGKKIGKEFWDKDKKDGKYSIVNEKMVNELQEDYNEAINRIEHLSLWLQRNEEDIIVKKAFSVEGYSPRTRLGDLVEWINFDFLFAEPNVSSLFLSVENNEFVDDDYFISDQRGFASFLDCIAKEIESKIHLGAVVNKISYNDDCVCASVTSDIVCGKYGIVTFSQGVLQEWIKSDRSKFIPNLSNRKQDAINTNKMGYYLKIFLQFNSPFWNTNVDYILRTDNQKGYYPVLSPIGQFLPGSPGVLVLIVVESEAYRLSYQ